MNARRLLKSLVLALLVSGLFTFWLSRRVAKANHAPAPTKRRYVAASRLLTAGETLDRGSLQLVDWAGPEPLAGGFTRFEQVTGRAVLYPLAKGEPILDRHLAAPGTGAGLTANIPSGMRAISVRSDEVVGVAGFLLPGTHVDVLVTYHSDKSPAPKTVTVLQDVEVLAAGQQTRPDPEGKPVSVSVVTLLLKPEDAERVVLATSLGAIHFVLRNGTDRMQSASSAVGLEQLTDEPAPLPRGQGGASQPPALKGKPYQVETILGDKRIISSF